MQIQERLGHWVAGVLLTDKLKHWFKLQVFVPIILFVFPKDKRQSENNSTYRKKKKKSFLS